MKKICKECKRKEQHHAKGFCKLCYARLRKQKDFRVQGESK